MEIEIGKRKITLALEVRKSCLGYAVFEGPERLLDWGATTPSPLEGSLQRAEKRFVSILKLLHPEVVVVKRPHQQISRGAILRFLKKETARRSIPILVMTQDEVDQAFSHYGAGNKDEIAEVLQTTAEKRHGRQ
jgi:hypothetical protein